jgi:hypothetical protein
MKPIVKKITYGSAFVFLSCFLLNIVGCTKNEEASPASNGRLNANAEANAAAVFVSNQKLPFDDSVFIPCANGGAGEEVYLSGTLHATYTITINGNNVRVKYHYQPQEVKGIGAVTGDQYNATGVTQDEINGSFFNGRYEETSINNFRIIGQGNGNNYLVHETVHVTVNANGVVTVALDKLAIDCK